MNNKRSSRNKESVTESPFFTSRRFIVCCVIACLAIVSCLHFNLLIADFQVVYNRSDSTDESSTETPIIPLATTFPALHPSIINQDLAIEAPQSRTLKGYFSTIILTIQVLMNPLVKLLIQRFSLMCFHSKL